MNRCILARRLEGTTPFQSCTSLRADSVRPDARGGRRPPYEGGFAGIGLLAMAFASVLGCGTASAQRMSKVDGNRLMGMCSAASSKIECESYLSGVADAIAAGGKATAEACIPPPVTITQLHDVVLKYLKDHPGERELKAGLLTLRAYAGAFACKR